MKKFLFSFSLFIFLGAGILYSQNHAIINAIDDYILQVQEGWKIPGLSVSIVKDGNLLWAKGYGVREIGKDTPVDENTVYQIGSISKSFTAMVMASIVDEGLVSWEDTVKKILPDFKWYDKWVEENMQVKDLMTHKTGLLGQQGTYIPNAGYGRDDIYKMFERMKPKYSFRSVYAYNNMTFIIAAKIIEQKTGKSWEENVQERIFDKLGMTSSSLNGEGFLEAGDKASIAHEFYYRGDSMYILPLYGDDRALFWETVVGPAGSVNSTVVDMAKYAQFHLNMGKVGEKEVLSEKSMKYLHKGQTIVSQTDDYIRLYGNCWFVEQNNRYRLYFHTGTTWGFTAICAFVPEIDLGLVVLVNSETPASPRYAIMRKTIDLFMGDTLQKDYNREYLDEWWSEHREESKCEEKVKEILPELEKSYLAGHYIKDQLFGDADVTLEEDTLFIRVGKQGWKRELKHVSGTEYTFRSDGHTFPVVFNLNKKGNKAISFDLDFGEEENFGPWIRK